MVDREETGAAGAAMIAAVERGLYADLPAAAEAWVTPSLGEATAPDPALVPLYARLYDVFRSVRQALPPAWRELAALRSKSP
jgi:erythritol kinase